MGKEKNVFAGTGISKNNDPYLAGKEAVEMAIEKCEKAPDFGILFCSGNAYGRTDKSIHKFVKGAHEAFKNVNPNIQWIGCTTGGEISHNGVTHNSAVALGVQSDYIRVKAGSGNHVSKLPKLAGKKAAEESLGRLKLDPHVDSYIRFQSTKNQSAKDLAKTQQFVIISLTPGFTLKKAGWEESVVDGIKEVAGVEMPIVGGSAADDSRFLKNYQFVNGKVYNDAIVCLSLFSDLKFGLGMAHGYEPTKKVVLVTKSKGDIVYELNNKPAVDVYAEMIGIDKKNLSKGLNFLQTMGKVLPDYLMRVGEKFGITAKKMSKGVPFYIYIMQNPLAIPDVHGDYWLKVPKGITKNGGLEFYNPIEEGFPLTYMKANDRQYLHSGATSIKNSKEHFDHVEFGLVFECIGRYVYLDTHRDQALHEMEKVLGTNNFIGFYTACEIGSSKKLPSSSHTYTCSSISFSNDLVLEKRGKHSRWKKNE